MKKLIISCLLGLCLGIYSCGKEDDLEPTEIKNWFAIEYREGMDAVDQKIYDLYTKYNIAIRYNDTLGREDRGRRDSVGNVVWRYEVIDWSYNITSTNWSFTREPVDVATWEAKSRMLPMLDFLEGMLSFVKDAKVNIPVIMLAESMKQGAYSWTMSAKNVFKGFNFLGVALNGFNDATKATYRSDFIAQTCAKKIEKMTDPFYEVTEMALASRKHGSSSIWECSYTGSSGSLVPEFAYFRANKDTLDIYDTRHAELLAEKEELERQIESGLLTEEDKVWVNCLENIAALEEVKANEASILEQYDMYCPEAFGLLGLRVGGNTTRVPSQSEDLDMYMSAIFTYSTEEFNKMYAKFPLVQMRFQLLREIMEKGGFDVDAVREGM